MERQVQDLNERVQEQEDRTNEMAKGKRQAEKECEELKRNVGDLEMSIRKAEAEKQSKDHQLRSLQVGSVITALT
jgi:peptidoglycan hydrolase CwlO-like protein